MDNRVQSQIRWNTVFVLMIVDSNARPCVFSNHVEPQAANNFAVIYEAANYKLVPTTEIWSFAPSNPQLCLSIPPQTHPCRSHVLYSSPCIPLATSHMCKKASGDLTHSSHRCNE